MNGDELAEDIALPDSEVGLLSPELEVLRDEADRRERKDLGFVADLGEPVDDRRRADAAAHPKTDMLADHRVRADDRAGANLGALHDDRRRVDADAVGHHGEQQIHFGDDLIAHIRDAARLRQRRARLQQRHLEAQLIARDDLPPELRSIDAVQIHARRGHRPFAVEHQGRCHLRQRLEHQHARHQRHAWKMPLKKIFVDRDVLVRDETLAGLVLVHGVDHE